MGTAEFIFDMIRGESRKAARNAAPSITIGHVVDVNPLRVRIGDYEIDEDFMRIASHCRRNVLKIPTNDSSKHTHECGDSLSFTLSGATAAGPVTFTCMPLDPTEIPPEPGPSVTFKHNHEIKPALPEILLWRGLRKGDDVLILKFESSSVHYIIERLDKLSNDGSSVDEAENISDPNEEEQL